MIWSRPDEIALKLCDNGYCLVTGTETLDLNAMASLAMGWGYLVIPIVVGIAIGFVIGYTVKRNARNKANN